MCCTNQYWNREVIVIIPSAIKKPFNNAEGFFNML